MRQKKMDAWAHNLLRLLLNLTQELQIHVAVVDGGGKALGRARILLDWGAAADGEGSVAVVDDGDPAAGGGEVKGEIRSPAQQRAHHAGIGGAAVEPGAGDAFQLHVTVLGFGGNGERRDVGKADPAVAGGADKVLESRVVGFQPAVGGGSCQIVQAASETPAKARRGSLTVRLQLRSTLGLCSSEKLEEGSMVLAMVRVLPSRVKV